MLILVQKFKYNCLMKNRKEMCDGTVESPALENVYNNKSSRK